jgi:hypothetical protein
MARLRRSRPACAVVTQNASAYVTAAHNQTRNPDRESLARTPKKP